MDDLFCIEVETIQLVMDQLDYYQLLKVDRAASQAEVQRAFFNESRVFHPDRYYGVADEEFKARVLEIYKRLAEAYGVLKEPDARAFYDERLARDGALRLDRAAFETASRSAANPEAAATTAQGRKFLALGLERLKGGDLKGAVMNLGAALSAEPENAFIKEQLELARAQAGSLKSSATSNPYRLRL